MTKNELIEAINSTIVANGQKGITAESLNLILNELVNSGGGTGGVTFYVGNTVSADEPLILTEDQKNHNAEMFDVIKNANPLPPVALDLSDQYGTAMGMSSNVKTTQLAGMIAYFPAEDAAAVGSTTECVAAILDGATLVVNPDGSTKMIMG